MSPRAEAGGDELTIPVYLKTSEEMPWPREPRVFYLLSQSGIFLCRNHEFFSSSVSAPDWPADLARHDKLLSLCLPKIPRRYVELAVGFFAQVAETSGGEAALVVLWDQNARRIRFHIPRQVATVRTSYSGRRIPVSLNYEVDMALEPGWTVIGDMHSHADEAAYCSGIDRMDEVYRPGLHVVVGRVDREPPEFHSEFVVDGARFVVPIGDALEGYRRRRLRVPESWLSRVRVKVEKW